MATLSRSGRSRTPTEIDGVGEIGLSCVEMTEGPMPFQPRLYEGSWPSRSIREKRHDDDIRVRQVEHVSWKQCQGV